MTLEVARYALRTFKRYVAGEYRYDTPYGGHQCVLEDDLLGPVGVNEPDAWKDGTCTADCVMRSHSALRPRPHDAPGKSCGCGVYGSHSLDHLILQYPNYTRDIVAVIAAEGETIIGSRGLRTQYARVVAWYSTRPSIRAIADRQFGEARGYGYGHGKQKYHGGREQMLADYGLPVHIDEPIDSPGGMSQWWTA